MKLAAAPVLALPVYEQLFLGEEVVQLTARIDDPRQLEQLPQPDHVSPDRNLVLFHAG